MMPCFHIVWDSEHLSQAPDIADLRDGARICVVLIGYDMDEHPINHVNWTGIQISQACKSFTSTQHLLDVGISI